jgi:5-methylcytosine-specific restriction endonuclease McrA
VIRRICVHRSRSCSGGGYALPGTSRCRAHTTNGWGSKKNKAARDAQYTDPVYRRFRAQTLAAKPNCVYPGCTKVADTLDHIIPVSLGGGNEPANLRPMCRKHNEALGRGHGNAMKRRKPN